jgi:hypothetical protein
MNTNKFLEYLPEKQTILARVNLSEANSDKVKVEENTTTDNSLVYGVFTGLFFTSTAILVTLLKKCSSRKYKTDYRNSFRTISQIPCKKCQYFSNNPYLKCAIRPLTVMSEEALDCPDYCPRYLEINSQA